MLGLAVSADGGELAVAWQNVPGARPSDGLEIASLATGARQASSWNGSAAFALSWGGNRMLGFDWQAPNEQPRSGIRVLDTARYGANPQHSRLVVPQALRAGPLSSPGSPLLSQDGTVLFAPGDPGGAAAQRGRWPQRAAPLSETMTVTRNASSASQRTGPEEQTGRAEVRWAVPGRAARKAAPVTPTGSDRRPDGTGASAPESDRIGAHCRASVPRRYTITRSPGRTQNVPPLSWLPRVSTPVTGWAVPPAPGIGRMPQWAVPGGLVAPDAGVPGAGVPGTGLPVPVLPGEVGAAAGPLVPGLGVTGVPLSPEPHAASSTVSPGATTRHSSALAGRDGDRAGMTPPARR